MQILQLPSLFPLAFCRVVVEQLSDVLADEDTKCIVLLTVSQTLTKGSVIFCYGFTF